MLNKMVGISVIILLHLIQKKKSKKGFAKMILKMCYSITVTHLELIIKYKIIKRRKLMHFFDMRKTLIRLALFEN